MERKPANRDRVTESSQSQCVGYYGNGVRRKFGTQPTSVTYPLNRSSARFPAN